MRKLLNLLQEPLMKNVDLDSEDRLLAHGKILKCKRMIREVFLEFHQLFHQLDEEYFSASGKKIELGAGASPIRNSYPDVLATDIVYSDNLDQVLNAEKINLPDNTIRAFYGQNCFHHFPHPELFFKEIDRVLAPGGGVILLEPYYGFFASFIFKRLFKNEGFDKKYLSWEAPISGPSSGANQALSYIVFIRDRDRFEKQYPSLKIVHQELCQNHLKYLLSGGLNFRQLLPDFLIPVVHIFQFLLIPFNRWIALHHIIVIRKDELSTMSGENPKF